MGARARLAGFDLSARVDGQPVYQIVNDEYSQTLSLQGVSQAVPLRAGQTLYGVRLDLTTYGHAFATGTLHAQLRQADGTRSRRPPCPASSCWTTPSPR